MLALKLEKILTKQYEMRQSKSPREMKDNGCHPLVMTAVRQRVTGKFVFRKTPAAFQQVQLTHLKNVPERQ